MSCTGAISFSLVNGIYQASVRGWTLTIACVGSTPFAFLLTVTQPGGGSTNYQPTSAQCSPFFLWFQGVLLDCGVVNITLGSILSPCADSSSAGSQVPTGITRTNKGVTSTFQGNSVTLSGVTIAANSLLIVVATVANQTTAPSVTFGGAALTKDVEAFMPGNAPFAGSCGCYSKATSGTGDIVVSIAGDPGGLAVQAVQVNGLANNAFDTSAFSAGSLTLPDSGPTALTSASAEYAQGGFLMVVPGGSVWTWQNGFASGAQDATFNLGRPVVATEGYRILSAQTTVEAYVTMAGNVPDAWCGFSATYK